MEKKAYENKTKMVKRLYGKNWRRG
jgi:hypothetical protein